MSAPVEQTAVLPLAQVGKRFPAALYAVGREKIREYARAVGEESPLCLDLDAARDAGYADLVAPPMFVAVYAGPAFLTALFDPELGIDFAHLVHGSQEFRWSDPVIAGDEITTVLEFKATRVRAGLRFDVFESRSTNQRGRLVSTGTWTNIIRGER